MPMVKPETVPLPTGAPPSIIRSCKATDDGVQEMDTRDIVAATLASAIFQTLISPVTDGLGDPPELIRSTREEAVNFAILLYQEVLAALPPETPADQTP